MKSIKTHKVSLRNYMIRIGGSSERHDRRAQREGFADKEASDAEFFNDEDSPNQVQNIDLSIPSFGNSTSIVPPSIN